MATWMGRYYMTLTGHDVLCDIFNDVFPQNRVTHGLAWCTFIHQTFERELCHAAACLRRQVLLSIRVSGWDKKAFWTGTRLPHTIRQRYKEEGSGQRIVR